MYNSKQYNVSQDKEFIKIINKNKLSVYTIATYQSTIKQFCDCIEKTYSDFVEEIKNTEGDDIDFENKKVYRYNPNNSLINDYVNQYMDFLKQKNNKQSTINNKIKQLLGLFKKSTLEVPVLNFTKEDTQKKKQLVTTDDIRYVLDNSNIHHQALISFIASTGIRRYDVVNYFKIEDFIEACSDFTDAVFLDDFLKEAPQDMIPYFEFIPHKTRKTGLPCKVCCSSETSNLILQSLKARVKSIEKHNRIHNDDLVLTEEDALFGSKRQNYIGKLNEVSVSVLFSQKDKLLKNHKKQILDNKLKNKEISRKEYKSCLENMPKFHPHALRYRFITTIRAYTSNRDISLLMEGHASSIATDKFYVGESDELFNKDAIQKTYRKIMPYLTINQRVDPVEYEFNKKENIQLKNKLDSLENKMNKFEEINDYLKMNNVLKDII